MASQKPFIHDLSSADLEHKLAALGEPAFRAKQIWVALYQNFISDIQEVTTLPKELRDKLAEVFRFSALTPIQTLESKDGLTQKTLFKLGDGALIEVVLMKYDQRRTLCISSQSGCPLGCIFCATGQMGFTRNLTSGEIVTQVLYYAQYLAAQGERVTNVVVMGMGEPFLNYEAVMAAIDRLNDSQGLGLGARRITISTVGIVPKIKQFADAGTQVNLAISLHTIEDTLRTQLMPINQQYPVKSILEACRYYVDKTNRRVTFEYALIEGVNDSKMDAELLAQHIKGLLCHVNLIRLNPTAGYNKHGTTSDHVSAFRDVLDAHHIPCTVRLGRGVEISAGCGQLAAESE
jgi:23S rRNA (adenine2503-C2)-methyltransferase